MPVGAFLLQGPVEPLRVPVLPRTAGPGQAVLRAESRELGLEHARRNVAPRVVGHHLPDPDPVPGEPGRRVPQEPGAGLAALVGEHLDEREPRMVIDRDVNVVEPGPRAGLPGGG